MATSACSVQPTGKERFFDRDEIIVSKTDTNGRITYANEVFLRLAAYAEDELLGEPHCIIRHPAMPRCVFRLLWERIAAGQEIFAYVINLAKDGAHYWVFAHVTPTFDGNGKITGYHSSRRCPSREAVEVAAGLYAQLLEVEEAQPTIIAGMDAATAALGAILEEKGMSYDELVFAL